MIKNLDLLFLLLSKYLSIQMWKPFSNFQKQVSITHYNFSEIWKVFRFSLVFVPLKLSIASSGTNNLDKYLMKVQRQLSTASKVFIAYNLLA